MTEANNPWRDKYRRAVAQQEKLEQTLTAQQAILHRAVTVLCSAAEGQDNSLDERLQAILASVKHNDVAGFDRMLKSLPRVTEEVEQRQQKQWKEIGKSLVNLAAKIVSDSNSDIKSRVKTFKKQLPAGPLIPATLKRQLQELTEIQEQALAANPKSSSGLLGKLFGDKAEQQNTSDTTQETLATEWEEVEEPKEAGLEGEILGPDPSAPSYHRERAIPERVLQEAPPIDEPPKVPERVSVILVELLEHFKTVPAAKTKAEKARKRIDQGLRWFELAPTLEDIRDFVLQAYIGADNDYREYLERVYGELTDILSALGVSIETEKQVRTAADQLHSHVTEGVASISQALTDHTDIDLLKDAVETNLHKLQQALLNFKKETPAPSMNESLAAQLQALANKVQQMEQNEETIREKLEEQKHKATTDALTGLPNREAYGERVYQETQRWQRYQHPLSMAVVDIDFFKKINDGYGHQTGDKVLKIVASRISGSLREVDFMARFGGEEFVILMPETTEENALILLNRIRENLAKTPFRYKEEKISITISIGISQFREDNDAEEVFARADKALYDAKEGGRNQCRVAEAS